MFPVLEKTIKNDFNEKQFQEFANEFFNGLDFSKRHKLDISSQFQDAVSNFFFFAGTFINFKVYASLYSTTKFNS